MKFDFQASTTIVDFPGRNMAYNLKIFHGIVKSGISVMPIHNQKVIEAAMVDSFGNLIHYF